MRVPFSRWTAVLVAGLSLSTMATTGCMSTGGYHMPGTSWATHWWHRSDDAEYASAPTPPSASSTPIAAATAGVPSHQAPKDPTITPYGGPGATSTASYPLGGAGYPSQQTAAVTPNYATQPAGASAQGGYYSPSYQGGASSQVAQGGTAQRSVYSDPASQANPYAGMEGARTADLRNGAGYEAQGSAWGGAPSTGGAAAPASSIQPYNGGAYQNIPSQPYGGTPTYNNGGSSYPQGSYSPPATNPGYGATTPTGTATPTQPPAEGYAPGSTSRYYADRNQPAPVDNASEVFDNSSSAGAVSPASYQGGSAYQGGSSYPTTGDNRSSGYPYP